MSRHVNRSSLVRSGQGPVGGPMYLVGTEPRDNATAFIGPLQQKIFDMLNAEDMLTQQEKDLLLGIYCWYQENHKVTRRQAARVVGMWNEKFGNRPAKD